MKAIRSLFLIWGLFLGVEGRASRSNDWEGMRSSLSFLARGSTGVTSPILESSTPWAKRNFSETSWVSENPALSSSIDDFEGRWVPFEVQSRSSGVFSYGEALEPSYIDTTSLRAKLADQLDESSQSYLGLGTRYIEKGMVFSAGYGIFRSARLNDVGVLDYRYYRDFHFQFAASGTVFDKEHFGRVDFGTGLKAVYRKGDELLQGVGDALRILTDAELKKNAFTGGLDYGFLYTAPSKWSGEWRWQGALVWKDVGSSQFFLGNKTSRARRFDAFPNHQIFGVGVATPNIWGGAKAGFRLEYREWTRDISIVEKIAWGMELRFPEALSLFAGFHHRSWSAGALLRFSHLEIELASFARQLGDDLSPADAPRNLAMELRYVF